MKKIVGFWLTIVLLLTTLSATADNVRTSGLYTYQIKGNGTVTITDFDWQNNVGDIYIPNMIDGYSVTAIGDAAFQYDMNISGQPVVVTLPQNVTMIGDFAFCYSPITTINIPASVKSIGDGAFAECRYLSQISVAPNHATYAAIDGALYNKKDKALIAYPYASQPAIPNGIKKIENYAMYGQTLNIPLSKFLPASVSEIGDYAFVSATIPMDVLAVREWAILPNSLQRVGAHAFESARFVGEGETSYDEWSKIHVLGNEIISIGTAAFMNCSFGGISSYNSIYADQSMIWGGDIAGAVKLYIGDIEHIPDYAFAGVTIERYDHPQRYEAMYWELDGRYTYIGNHAFDCESVNERLVPTLHFSNAIVDSIGERAFNNCGVKGTVTIDTDNILSESLTGMLSSWRWGKLGTVSPLLPTGDLNVIISQESKAIPSAAFAGLNCIDSIYFPSTISKIGDGCFKLCSVPELDLSHTIISTVSENTFAFSETETILLPNTVQTIGDFAFMNGKVHSIVLPANVLSIGNEAFSNCYNLASIELPDNLTSIGEHCFSGCPFLRDIHLFEHIESIGDNAFERATITITVVPNSYAELWAAENGYAYKYDSQVQDDLSWLN